MNLSDEFSRLLTENIRMKVFLMDKGLYYEFEIYETPLEKELKKQYNKEMRNNEKNKY